jgi:hypothetical protein
METEVQQDFRASDRPIPDILSEATHVCEAELDELMALDMLHHALEYLAATFNTFASHADVKTNFESRVILVNCSNLILCENGCGISRADVEGRAADVL